MSSPADSVDKTFEKQRVQIWSIFILSTSKTQSVCKLQTDADLRICDIYATEYLDPIERGNTLIDKARYFHFPSVDRGTSIVSIEVKQSSDVKCGLNGAIEA